MRISSVIAIALLLSGCGAVYGGTLDRSGFRHLRYEYRVALDAQGGLLTGWMLDNYRFVHSDGEPMLVKSAPSYVMNLRRDVDGDGASDDLGAYPVDDLRFRSAETAGAIWLRTIPLPVALARTELRVLARMYVDAVSGSGLEVVELSPGHVTGVARRFATRDVQGLETAFDGREAFQVMFEVANVDQEQAGGDPRWERAHIVFVRTHLLFATGARVGVQFLPVLMIAGYANLPDDFAREHPRFHDFLSRIQLDTETVRALRPAVSACVPGAEPVSFVVTSIAEYPRGPNVDAYAVCLRNAVGRVDLGRIVGFRALAIPRTPYVAPPPATPQAHPPSSAPPPDPPPAPASPPLGDAI